MTRACSHFLEPMGLGALEQGAADMISRGKLCLLAAQQVRMTALRTCSLDTATQIVEKIPLQSIITAVRSTISIVWVSLARFPRHGQSNCRPRLQKEIHLQVTDALIRPIVRPRLGWRHISFPIEADPRPVNRSDRCNSSWSPQEEDWRIPSARPRRRRGPET
jgi:hypothetical protein